MRYTIKKEERYMKKSILYLCLPLLLLGLSSCDSTGGGSDTTNTKPISGTNNSSGTTEKPAEDFTIKTSDNGLSADTSSYTFANAEEGDDYPDAVIALTTDQTWLHCTGLNENYTKIIIEDETVLPKDSVTMHTVLNRDIVGASGSNDIDGINLILDRKLIKPGDSKLKLQVRPSNGSSSIAKTTTICVDVHVKEFGTIMVDTYDVDVKVNLDGLADTIKKESENPTSITLSITDSSDREEVYGYSADYSSQTDIPLAEIPAEISVSDIKYAVGHTYKMFIFVEGEKVSDRIWLSLKASSTTDGYSIRSESASQSILEVTKDGVTVEAEIDTYLAL